MSPMLSNAFLIIFLKFSIIGSNLAYTALNESNIDENLSVVPSMALLTLANGLVSSSLFMPLNRFVKDSIRALIRSMKAVNGLDSGHSNLGSSIFGKSIAGNWNLIPDNSLNLPTIQSICGRNRSCTLDKKSPTLKKNA